MRKGFVFGLGLALAAAVFQTASAQSAPLAGRSAASASAAPSSPAVAATVETLQKVCLPVLRGGDLKTAAQSVGYQMKDGVWVLPIAAKRRIELIPPDTANPTVCGETILSSPGSGAGMRRALDAWARAQTPPLAPVKADVPVSGPLYQRMISTWERQTRAGMEGVVLSQVKTLAGKPVAGDLDRSTVLVSVTPA